MPKHVQLADYLRARIHDGTYPPRAKLPSEVTLVQETALPAPVRKAMAVLADEGWVYVVRGLGTFVSPAG